MSNLIIGFPNQIDATFYTARIVGGAWSTSLPLTNLKDERLAYVARSSDATNASTQFHVDTGVIRQCKVWAIPTHTFGRTARWRLRATDTIKWSGVTVSGAHLAGVSSLLLAAAAAVTITSGEYFLVGSTEYKATSTVSITAGGTGSVSITPVLAANAANGASVTCLIGDYTTPDLDTGWNAVYDRIYPWGSLPFGHPSFWDGRPTDEDILRLRLPVYYVAEDALLVRYHLFEFDDTTNAAGYCDISRLFLGPGWQPSVNAEYGMEVVYVASTTMDESLGGTQAFERRAQRRQVRFSLDYVPKDEGVVQGLDIQDRQGVDKQVFFIFDPEDDESKARTSFLATLKSMVPIKYNVHDHIGAGFELTEVI